MSWKEDFIAKYGESAYKKRLIRGRESSKEWYKRNPEKAAKTQREWRRRNPEEVRKKNREIHQKGGKYYESNRKYNQTGIPGARERIREHSRVKWRRYKHIIAPDSQLHHQWRPQSALYDGLALVEGNSHMYGFVDVIKILEGKITLFTEKEIKEQGESEIAF